MSLARTPTDGGASPRQLLLLAIPAIVLGVFAALLLWALEQLADLLSGVLWDTPARRARRRPERLVDRPGAHPHRARGRHRRCGTCPATAGPTRRRPSSSRRRCRSRVLPGLALVTVLGLAGGVSLGPENPIIAINCAHHRRPLRAAAPAGARADRDAARGAATVGALFGTPVAAALLFTGIVAAAKAGGSLWDRLFLPVAAAGAGAITMHLLGAPPLAFDLPAVRQPAGDRPRSPARSSRAAPCVIGLAALVAFPIVYRALHALRHPILIPTVGGLILGILGLIGGPITMFKGLDADRRAAAGPRRVRRRPARRDRRHQDPRPAGGGERPVPRRPHLPGHVHRRRARPARARALPGSRSASRSRAACSASSSSSPATAGSRSSSRVAIPGDITLLPMLCVIVLPAWLLVSRAPEFRIVPPRRTGARATGTPAARAAGHD